MEAGFKNLLTVGFMLIVSVTFGQTTIEVKKPLVKREISATPAKVKRMEPLVVHRHLKAKQHAKRKIANREFGLGKKK